MKKWEKFRERERERAWQPKLITDCQKQVQ